MSLLKMLMEKDYDGLATVLSDWLDHPFTGEQIKLVLNAIRTRPCYEEACLVWLKNRLLERALLPTGCQEGCLAADTARLHVFFLSLEETGEMRARLWRHEEPSEADLARSKISKTHLTINPVDCVAKRVVKMP